MDPALLAVLETWFAMLLSPVIDETALALVQRLQHLEQYIPRISAFSPSAAITSSSAVASTVTVTSTSTLAMPSNSTAWSSSFATATATSTPTFAPADIPEPATVEALAPIQSLIGTLFLVFLVSLSLCWYKSRPRRPSQVNGAKCLADPPEEAPLSCSDLIATSTHYDWYSSDSEHSAGRFADHETLEIIIMRQWYENQGLRRYLAMELLAKDAEISAINDRHTRSVANILQDTRRKIAAVKRKFAGNQYQAISALPDEPEDGSSGLQYLDKPKRSLTAGGRPEEHSAHEEDPLTTTQTSEPSSSGEGAAHNPADQEKDVAPSAPVPTEEAAALQQSIQPEAAPGTAISEDGASKAPVVMEAEPETLAGDRETEVPGADDDERSTHASDDGTNMEPTAPGTAISEDGASKAPVAMEAEPEMLAGDRETEVPGADDDDRSTHASDDGANMAPIIPETVRDEPVHDTTPEQAVEHDAPVTSDEDTEVAVVPDESPVTDTASGEPPCEVADDTGDEMEFEASDETLSPVDDHVDARGATASDLIPSHTSQASETQQYLYMDGSNIGTTVNVSDGGIPGLTTETPHGSVLGFGDIDPAVDWSLGANQDSPSEMLPSDHMVLDAQHRPAGAPQVLDPLISSETMPDADKSFSNFDAAAWTQDINDILGIKPTKADTDDLGFDDMAVDQPQPGLYTGDIDMNDLDPDAVNHRTSDLDTEMTSDFEHTATQPTDWPSYYTPATETPVQTSQSGDQVSGGTINNNISNFTELFDDMDLDQPTAQPTYNMPATQTPASASESGADNTFKRPGFRVSGRTNGDNVPKQSLGLGRSSVATNSIMPTNVGATIEPAMNEPDAWDQAMEGYDPPRDNEDYGYPATISQPPLAPQCWNEDDVQAEADQAFKSMPVEDDDDDLKSEQSETDSMEKTLKAALGESSDEDSGEDSGSDSEAFPSKIHDRRIIAPRSNRWNDQALTPTPQIGQEGPRSPFSKINTTSNEQTPTATPHTGAQQQTQSPLYSAGINAGYKVTSTPTSQPGTFKPQFSSKVGNPLYGYPVSGKAARGALFVKEWAKEANEAARAWTYNGLSADKGRELHKDHESPLWTIINRMTHAATFLEEGRENWDLNCAKFRVNVRQQVETMRQLFTALNNESECPEIFWELLKVIGRVLKKLKEMKPPQ